MLRVAITTPYADIATLFDASLRCHVLHALFTCRHYAITPLFFCRIITYAAVYAMLCWLLLR